MQGGGVALMRHALIRLCRRLNLDVHWWVHEAPRTRWMLLLLPSTCCKSWLD